MTRSVEKVAIIGAGPGGLAAARVFLANSNFDIVLYERSQNVGGVWYYPPNAPHKDTAMYDELETNLCKEIMQFSGFPFPETAPTFPNRTHVEDYLQAYFHTFIEPNSRVDVRQGCNVERLEKINGSWHIYAKHSLQAVDYVVVANGHFDVPYIPWHLPGLEQWISQDPMSILHSKGFESCKFSRGKNVLVVGNGSSGSDITNQVSTTANHVFHSVTDISKTNWEANTAVTAVTTISELDYAHERSVRLQDGSILTHIDYIIWATGYMYDLPFLRSYRPLILGADCDSKPARRLYNVWEQLAFTEDPTLAFSLLCKNVVPFPLAELQAAVMVKVFKGELEVPPSGGQAALSGESPSDAANSSKDYHSLITPRDIEYCRELQALLDAHDSADDPFQPVRWDERMAALRYQTGAMKQERTKLLVKNAKGFREQNQPYRL